MGGMPIDVGLQVLDLVHRGWECRWIVRVLRERGIKRLPRVDHPTQSKRNEMNEDS